MNQGTIRKQSYGGKDMENNGQGVSAFENEKFVKDFVAVNKFKKILDVGAGSGYYGRILKNSTAVLDAAEIWEPSVKYLLTTGWYNWITSLDIREYEYELGVYDLVIFGDVLEHLSIEDAIRVFIYAHSHAKYVLVSIPNSLYPQEALYGNDHERHLIEDPVADLIPLLPEAFITHEFDTTNTYIWHNPEI